MAEAKELAEEDASSLNQFVVLAVAERVAGLRARKHWAERAERSAPDGMLRVLAKAGTQPPDDDDRVPEGYFAAGP